MLIKSLPQAFQEAVVQRLLERAKNNEAGNPFSAYVIDTNYPSKNVLCVNEAKTNPILHAEIVTLNAFTKYGGFTRSTIIISSGEPCPMCLTAIAWCNIREVYFIKSYREARRKGFDYDKSSKQVSKFLHLPLTIYQWQEDKKGWKRRG